MKALKGVLITLVVIIAIVGVTVIGGYVAVRSKYGIDLFRTAGQLKTLSKEVDEKSLCPNAFGEDDFKGLQTSVNNEVNGLIKYQAGQGYNGYTVDFQAIAGKAMSASISLSEKQVGALAETVFVQQTGGKVTLGNKDVDVKILQVDFSDIAENGSANFNVVTKIDLTPFKDDMKKFPESLFKKHVPDFLYVSSTVRVNKTTDAGFEYTVSHKSLTLNNLNADDTADLFHTLDAVLKIGSAEDVNLKIGSVAVNALIGNAQNVGFAYALKGAGAKNFVFMSVQDTTSGDTVDFFVVN